MVIHGKIYTVNSNQPWAEALAIRKGVIIAVGADKAIEEYRGPFTKVIDAAGHVVFPGFTDTHVHFMSGSLRLTQVQLGDATNIAELQRASEAICRDTSQGSLDFGQRVDVLSFWIGCRT